MILEQRFFTPRNLPSHNSQADVEKKPLLFFLSSKVFEVGVTVPTPSPQTVYNNSKSSKPLPKSDLL